MIGITESGEWGPKNMSGEISAVQLSPGRTEVTWELCTYHTPAGSLTWLLWGTVSGETQNNVYLPQTGNQWQTQKNHQSPICWSSECMGVTYRSMVKHYRSRNSSQKVTSSKPTQHWWWLMKARILELSTPLQRQCCWALSFFRLLRLSESVAQQFLLPTSIWRGKSIVNLVSFGNFLKILNCLLPD